MGNKVRAAVANGNVALVIHHADAAKLNRVCFLARGNAYGAFRLIKTILGIVLNIVNSECGGERLKQGKQLVYLFLVNWESRVVIIGPAFSFCKGECAAGVGPAERGNAVGRYGKYLVAGILYLLLLLFVVAYRERGNTNHQQNA